MKDDFTEKTITKTEDGVKTEKTVGKDGDSKWEKTEIAFEDMAPTYREEIDENGRRKGSAVVKGEIAEDFPGDVQDGLDEEDKAWLDILWRSPSDTEHRYHRAIQAFKESRNLGNDEESKKEVEQVFGLDENEQAVDYPTKEGLAFLKKAVDRPEVEVEEKEEIEDGD